MAGTYGTQLADSQPLMLRLRGPGSLAHSESVCRCRRVDAAMAMLALGVRELLSVCFTVVFVQQARCMILYNTKTNRSTGGLEAVRPGGHRLEDMHDKRHQPNKAHEEEGHGQVDGHRRAEEGEHAGPIGAVALAQRALRVVVRLHRARTAGTPRGRPP